MPELLSVLESSRKDKQKDREFFAALQGIRLDEGNKDTPSFDDVKRRALGLDGDVTKIQGQAAIDNGFGIGQGLGYREE